MASILVTGVAGLLGAHVAALLSRTHNVIGCDRHPWWGDQPVQMLQRDLLAPGAIAEVMAAVKPDIVIHCAALADVDACEDDPARSFAYNAQLSGDLAHAVPPRSLVVYISTDSVFNGRFPCATEDHTPAPRMVYAQSKLAGERLVQQAAAHHLIVRTNFYGWSAGRKRTFGEWLYKSLETGNKVHLFTDFWFTPIYVVDFVRRLKLLIERREHGIVHLAGRERISKYDFGLLLARTAGFSTEAITPNVLAQGGLRAPRPNDISLDSHRFEQITGASVPGCAEGLRRFLRDRTRPLSQRFDTNEEPDGPIVVPMGQASRWTP